jgi:hypothetical protein
VDQCRISISLLIVEPMSLRLRVLLILIPGFLILTSRIAAQNLPLVVTVSITPPYTTDVSQYLGGSNQTTVSIFNPNTQPLQVFLAGSLSNLTTGQTATIPSNQVPGVPPLNIPAGPSNVQLTGQELQTYINTGAIEFQGISSQEALNGNLPEGVYQLCLRAHDYSTLEPLSGDAPQGCSIPFPVLFVQPPFLMAPMCGSEVPGSTPQNILFTWVPPVGAPAGSNIIYRIRLVELPDGMSPIQAMQATGTPLLNDSTFNTLYLLSSFGPALQAGREYAWQITARDVNQLTVFTNEGKSEICTFRLSIPFSNGPVSANLVYPKPGSRIPFRNVPLVARFQPLSESVRGFRAETSLMSVSGQDASVREELWPSGREAFINSRIGMLPELEQLLHIPVGRNLVSSPGSAIMERGEMQTVLSTLQFNQEDGQTVNASLSSNFESGMPKPLLQEPVRDTTLFQHRVTLKFRADNFPKLAAGEHLLLPAPEIVRSLTGPDAYWFVAQIQEQYKLEVARDADFDSVVTTIYGKYERKDTITPGKSESALRIALIKQFSHDVFLPDTGFYYWRVSWLKSTADTSAPAYIRSDPEKFLLLDGIAGEATNSACMADCDAPVITDRVPVTSIAVGDSVSIGKFKMKISSIQYLGTSASGKGVIRVPFWGANVKVAFSAIQINAQKQVFFGSVGAEYDNSGLIPNIPGIGDVRLNLPDADSLDAFLAGQHDLLTANPDAPMGLPLGIDKEVEGERILIAVMAASFQPEKATLAAGINIPLFGLLNSQGVGIDKISLGASDICFHPGGLAGVSMGTLFLPEDVEIHYADQQKLVLRGTDVNLQTGAIADSGCYVSWDCEGFRALRIQGSVDFDTTLLIKENLAGEPDMSSHVNARFAFTVRRTGNWMASLDFDRFQIPGIKGWGFDIKNATLDFSDLGNPAEMVFPAGYPGDRSVLWNGFFLKELEVHLPKEFGKTEDETVDATSPRIRFAARNLIIDHTGISGTLAGENLLSLQQGRMGNWGFSLDSLAISFVSNSFASGGFKGKMLTPLSPSHFVYQTSLSQGAGNSGLRYDFRIQPSGSIEVPMWTAQLEILPSSNITVVADTGGFKPVLNLNGNIGIDATIGSMPIKFDAIHFEQLRLETRAPFISCSTFSFASPPKFLAGFPISISDLSLGTQSTPALISWDDSPGERTALNFTLNLNLTGDPSPLAGSTKLAIVGRIDMGDLGRVGDDPHPDQFDFPAFVPTGIDLKAISMDADMGAVKIKGMIQFYAEDPVFGTGFNGAISADFVNSFKIEAVAGFGTVQEMRYWYVDAAVTFMPGIPLYTGIDLYGFGGGAFYKMAIQGSAPPADEIPNAPPPAFPTPGTLLSGIQLRPSQNAFFGFLATVKLGSTGGGQVYNVDLTVGVDFTTSGGVGSVTFVGDAYFMSSMSNREFTSVNARAQLTYNIPDNIFSGELDVKVNVPLVLQGTGPENSVGKMFMYAGPDKWNVLVGTPTSRIGVKILSTLDLQAYLMMGSEIPAPGTPPATVLQAFNYVPSRSPGIASGAGIAFGANMHTSFGEPFGPFTCRLGVDVGFDLNLMNTGSANCDGLAAGTKPGINGWYASGQIYGYFTGSIGIIVDFMGNTGEYKILDVTAAALLEGGFPNPYWYKGQIRGDYNLFNGLLSGTCIYKIEEGEKCAPPVESPLAGIKMIQAVLPESGAQDVDPAIIPGAVFNVDIDQSMTIQKMNGDGSVSNQQVRFIVESYTLKKGSVSQTATVGISDDRSRAFLNLNALLKADTTYSVSLKVLAQQRSGNQWIPLTRANGTVIREQIDYTFKTGALPDKILPSMVQYSIPFNRQRFFPQNTCSNGFIQTRQDISSIFLPPRSGYERKYYARFMPINGGSVIESDAFPYQASTRRMNFNLPDLNRSTVYRMQIIHRDVRLSSNSTSTSGQLVNGNLVNASLVNNLPGLSTQFQNMLNNSIQLRLRGFGDQMALSSNEHLYYEYYFRTSQFDQFSDKVNAIQAMAPEVYDYNASDPANPEEMFMLNFYCPEKFEAFDLQGQAFTQTNGSAGSIRSLQIKALGNTSWYTSFANPVIYDLYTRIKQNNYNSRVLYRLNPDPYGIPALNIVYANGLASPLSDAEVGLGSTTSSSSGISLLGNTTLSGGINSNIIGSSLLGGTTANGAFILESAYWGKEDYDKVAQMVAEMRVRYGVSLSGVDATTKAKITTFLNTPFKRMSAQTTSHTLQLSNTILNCSNPAPGFSLNKTFAQPATFQLLTPIFIK